MFAVLLYFAISQPAAHTATLQVANSNHSLLLSTTPTIK